MDGFPTAATFPGSAQLDLVRLFGTLRLAERPICQPTPPAVDRWAIVSLPPVAQWPQR